jgi:hypothetical protein
MSGEDRDKKFEQALQQYLRAEPAEDRLTSGQDQHPDAELLGAFHERMLSDIEMQATKEHVSGCSRCQEILTMLEATDEIAAATDKSEFEHAIPTRTSAISIEALHPSSAGRVAAHSPSPSAGSMKPRQNLKTPPGRRALWQVMAAMGAVAAVFFLFISLREPKYHAVTPSVNLQVAQEAAQDQLTAQSTQPTPPPPNPAPGVGGQTPAASGYSSAARMSPDTVEKKNIEPTTRGGAAAPNSPTNLPLNGRNVDSMVALDKSRGDELRRERGGLATSEATATGVLAGKVATRAAKPAAPETSPKETAASAPAAAPTPSAQQPTAPALEEKKTPAAVQQEKGKDAAVAPGSVAQTVEVTSADVPSKSESKAAFSDRNQVQVEATQGPPSKYITVVTPDGTVSWRVARHGRIERSTDSGTHWKRQNSGTSRDLLAGAAPSSSVCWVVGRAGTILRTTDGGGHWNKVASPLTEDIAQVAAADALNATVSAGDQHLVTTDGGETWGSIRE